MNNIVEYDIKTWVEEAQKKEVREFRQAVHTILCAIASDENLKASMILKGGILLAIRYHSYRYTKDIDFSTERKLGDDFTLDGIRDSLDNSLALMVEELDYDLDCRVQSCKLQPKKPDATFPSIKLKIGFAYKGTPKHKWLIVLKSPTTISIDYSLNEFTPNIENIKLNDNEEILAYTLTDLIAEKYRSLLQQVTRNRNRRQDVFDLNLLIEKLNDIDADEKFEIMKCLISKSRSRNINPDIDSLENPEIRSRAKKDYPTLEDDLYGELPDFNKIFDNVLRFYKSLPWKFKK